MMIHDRKLIGTLQTVARRLARDTGLHDDLMQEALFHLWSREQQCPGQTRSWYCQSCRFHLQNYLRSGRSVDSPRRRADSASQVDASLLDSLPADGEDSQCLLSLVSQRETFELLWNRLSPPDRQILYLLAVGNGIRDIAVQMNLSHTSVVRRRRGIALLATRLGIEPLSAVSRNSVFGVPNRPEDDL